MSAAGETPTRLSESQLVDWLRLIRSENIGPRTFRQLLNRYGGAAAALEALPGLVARQIGGRAIGLFSRDEALAELEAARRMGVRFLATSDADYPPLLREIDNAPPLLALRGEAAALKRDCVAIVGARNASSAGTALAQLLARDFVRADLSVVSGLARGVDAAAHRASLAGGAIAVLAGGHARPYPAENVELLEEIVASGGAAISEMPLEWEPRGRDFPRRNRLVSGVSRAVVVVEAARRSGSLITARFAAEQGREVFAAPGSPLDPRAEGTNDLLREGASLCTRAEDVIRALASARPGPRPGADLFGEGESAEEAEPLFDELDLFSFREAARKFPSPPPSSQPPSPPPSPDPAPQGVALSAAADAREAVLSLLSPTPVSLDELIRASGLPAREVQGALLDLDLEGRLERHGGALVSLLTRLQS
ncbi:MAG TPA: DNA-processing protein DprA [Methylocystis sp.]|nr:DNA-processing protein DprA [Methylocystis sp.]